MIRNRIVAVAFALLAALDTSASSIKGVETGDLNRQIEPCTDFYEFANGTWRAENPIPESKARWSRRIAAQEANRLQVQRLLEEIAQKTDWPSGSDEQRIGDYFASCIDESSIDAAGLTPLTPLLREIDAVQNQEGVQRIIRRLHELAVAVPFGITGAVDYHEPSQFLLNIVAGTRITSDREHIASVLELGEMSPAQASQAATGILALEARLAAVSVDGATTSDVAATNHKMTFAQLRQFAPHFDWNAYFDEAKLPKVELNVPEPKFVQQLDQELQETPVDVWKHYLAFQLLDSASPWLSKKFADNSKPRAQRCAADTEAMFGDAVGRKYAERYLPPAAKAKADEIARNLLAALREDVAGVSWMEPATKKKALEKLAATSVQLGYPDERKHYAAVTIRRGTFWANMAAARKFNVDDARQWMGRPTNRNVWFLPPSSPAAYIDLQLNTLVLPAGFLQPPYFNAAATDAVNYGALGIGLAHDLTHMIDASGSETDIAGRPRNWWTDADRKQFEARSQCVIDQFDGYFIEPGVAHQGKRVLSEAVGDLAGVRLAYAALEKSMKTHPVPTVDGFTPEQQFFIAWGQTTGAAMRIEAQRKLVSGDPHPVPKFRVIGPLSNSPEFSQAFSCKAGAAMVRPQEKRCAVW